MMVIMVMIKGKKEEVKEDRGGESGGRREREINFAQAS